jgi:hypothetical protein
MHGAKKVGKMGTEKKPMHQTDNKENRVRDVVSNPVNITM